MLRTSTELQRHADVPVVAVLLMFRSRNMGDNQTLRMCIDHMTIAVLALLLVFVTHNMCERQTLRMCL